MVANDSNIVLNYNYAEKIIIQLHKSLSTK